MPRLMREMAVVLVFTTSFAVGTFGQRCGKEGWAVKTGDRLWSWTGQPRKSAASEHLPVDYSASAKPTTHGLPFCAQRRHCVCGQRHVDGLQT